MPTPVTSALELAEDAILDALDSLAPVGNAAWSLAPVGTISRLRAISNPLERFYVAQHQDGGGSRRLHLHSDGWSGLIVVRVLSADDADARTGFGLVVTAMAGLASPAGHGLWAAWDAPVSIPRDGDGIYTRAGQWRVDIRRVG